MALFLRCAMISLLVMTLAEPFTPLGEHGPQAAAARTFEIIINARTFSPPVLALPLNERITLIIKNEDGELHAFVPLLLLQETHVQVAGNAAPEFNETGLARVLIPPHGRAELTFRPKAAGAFFYICDLPGHQMRAEIIIGEALAGAPAGR
jgi:uncharacterized cupredoxin-like copper-binding protein